MFRSILRNAIKAAFSAFVLRVLADWVWRAVLSRVNSLDSAIAAFGQGSLGDQRTLMAPVLVASSALFVALAAVSLLALRRQSRSTSSLIVLLLTSVGLWWALSTEGRLLHLHTLFTACAAECGAVTDVPSPRQAVTDQISQIAAVVWALRLTWWSLLLMFLGCVVGYRLNVFLRRLAWQLYWLFDGHRLNVGAERPA
jgi:hypothetical protein